MTTLSNRKSVLAIVKEVTEGTPVLPSAATDYVSLQEGYTLESSFNELTNDEIINSLAMAKGLLGLENPTASISHYMKHSGTEGVAPEIGDLLESLFGNVETNGTEYNTIAGSTAGTSSARAIVKVDSAEGLTFSRGEALLIKDAVNNYSIRNVFSISTDDLSLGFNLADAPAAGVDLGKAIFYYPANESHPTLTLANYRANGGAIELIAGARCMEMSLDITAGELVNAEFSLEGLSYSFNPLQVTASNTYIDYNEGGASSSIAISQDTYKDPHELAAQIQTQLDDSAAATITCTYSDSTGKFTIVSDGGTFELEWKTGTNGADGTDTHIGTLLGYGDAADDTGAVTYTGDTAIVLTSPDTPTYNANDPLVAKNNDVMIGDYDDYACFNPSSVNVTLANTKKDLLSICAESGKSGSIFTRREVTIEVVSYLNKYDVDKFRKFRENENTAFCYNFGEKSGQNWIAGKCVNIYVPTATITAFSIADDEGVVTLNMTLKAYTDNGSGEVYLNFL
jgi:hypothetical protein